MQPNRPANGPDLSDSSDSPGGGDRWLDPVYRTGVIDLLGALAYGELSAFLRLAADAELAPALGSRVALARLAALEFSHYELLAQRLQQLDVDPQEAMAPFVSALDSFHARTTPATWYEGLVKYYVGDAIASDFYREISNFLDDDTRDLIVGALDSPGKGEFIAAEVQAVTAEDSVLASRLGLWGRRLMGEALSQGQRVVADRDSLAALLASGVAPGMDLVSIVEMFGRITQRHTERMTRLGLSA